MSEKAAIEYTSPFIKPYLYLPRKNFLNKVNNFSTDISNPRAPYIFVIQNFAKFLSTQYKFKFHTK